MYQYKIVDDFNGFEDNEVFDSIDAAKAKIFKMRREFHSNIQNKNCDCRLKIVSAESQWYFYPRYNKFIWG